MRGTGPVRGKHICPRDVRQPESEYHLSRSPSPSWLGCFKQRLQFKVPRHVTVGCSRDEQRPKRGCLISLLMRRKSRVESANRDGYGISALGMLLAAKRLPGAASRDVGISRFIRSCPGLDGMGQGV